MAAKRAVFEHVEIAAHSLCVYDMVFSSDGLQLASTALDGKLNIWNVRNGELVKDFASSDYALSLAFAPNGEHLIAGTIDGRVVCFDTTEWKPETVRNARSQIQSMAFSADGEVLALGARPIRLLRASDFSTIASWEAHELGRTVVVLSADGSTLVSGNADMFVRVWGPPRSLRFEKQYAHWTEGLDLHPDDTTIAVSSFRKRTGGYCQNVELLDVHSGAVLDTLTSKPLKKDVGASVRCAFTSDGKHLITMAVQSPKTGSVSIWDLSTKTIVASHDTYRSLICLAVSPTGKHLAVADVEGQIDIWEFAKFVRTNRCFD